MTRITIIGTGNIGTSIANGLAGSGHYSTGNITLTRRKFELLKEMKLQGYNVQRDNYLAAESADVIILAVEPQQLNCVLTEIAPALDPDCHTVISVVTGVRINQVKDILGPEIPVIRAMPNTAIAVRESMTCLASNESPDKLKVAEEIFSTVGQTIVIDEEEMIAATALGACGIAFFLRAIRAAAQGGIEVGFCSHEALSIAAQTAKGAALLLLSHKNHPEPEIDKVTTPRGCTIAGLNQMEHEGFSSAMIKGITVSAEKAAKLYFESKQKINSK